MVLHVDAWLVLFGRRGRAARCKESSRYGQVCVPCGSAHNVATLKIACAQQDAFLVGLIQEIFFCALADDVCGGRTLKGQRITTASCVSLLNCACITGLTITECNRIACYFLLNLFYLLLNGI